MSNFFFFQFFFQFMLQGFTMSDFEFRILKEKQQEHIKRAKKRNYLSNWYKGKREKFWIIKKDRKIIIEKKEKSKKHTNLGKKIFWKCSFALLKSTISLGRHFSWLLPVISLYFSFSCSSLASFKLIALELFAFQIWFPRVENSP